MEESRRRLLARSALAAAAVLGACWLARLDWGRKIATSVLDLIPSDTGSAEIRVLRGLAEDRQARVALFALSDPARPSSPPLAAARRFAADLSASPAFSQAAALEPSGVEETLGREVFARRFRLLLPTWLGVREREFRASGLPAAGFSSWLAERSAADLEAFLARPEAPALQGLIPRDPLLLVPGLLDRLPALGGGGEPNPGAALVWATLSASPFTSAGQGPVFAAVESARRDALAAAPGLQLRWTGVDRFAALSRSRIQSEIKLLNLLSLGAVLAVACLFVRRFWKLLHLAPVLGLSLLGAWCVSTALFARLHVLVFVLGSLLTGVAVDYGFYIYLQPFAGPSETYGQRLGRLLRPLLASCLTTVIGFSLLLASDLPLIRQLGVYVAAGLLTALGAAMLYFAQLRRPFLESRRLPSLPSGPAARAAARVAAVLAAGVVVLGPWRLRWRDDIRELDLPSPALHANDDQVRALFGEGGDRAAYLSYGSSLANARDNLGRFERFLARQGVASGSLGLIFPTEEDWAAFPARLRSLPAFAADFRAALERHGFLPDAFAPFFAEWAGLERSPPSGSYQSLYAQLAPTLAGPLGELSSANPKMPWFITLADRRAPTPPPPALSTVDLAQLQSLNQAFARYRWSALRLSLIGLALIIASVFAIYPLRRAWRIALIPAGSCFFIFGLFGLCGLTLNLFNLLGAFLGVCLSHNYSIFSSETAAAGAAPPTPVRLSALCAAASFGVLAASRIPVVHSLGLTVAAIVLCALAAIELEPLVRGRVRA